MVYERQFGDGLGREALEATRFAVDDHACRCNRGKLICRCEDGLGRLGIDLEILEYPIAVVSVGTNYRYVQGMSPDGVVPGERPDRMIGNREG